MAQVRGYELIDAGDERRLERFGPVVVDRPAPGADEPLRDAEAWSSATLRFDQARGWERVEAGGFESWVVEVEALTLELRPTATGQVGLFPEHASQLEWLRTAVKSQSASRPAVLNMFASTGLATLGLAAAGAAVAHVDAARPAVAWARRNADLSRLTDRPIRWLVDDALGFVKREARRSREYQGLVLDPPSYGHGGGRTWRLEDDLSLLLEACREVLTPDAFVLLTAHTPGFGPDRLARELAATLRRPTSAVEAGELALDARSGARLALGAFARVAG